MNSSMRVVFWLILLGTGVCLGNDNAATKYVDAAKTFSVSADNEWVSLAEASGSCQLYLTYYRGAVRDLDFIVDEDTIAIDPAKEMKMFCGSGVKPASGDHFDPEQVVVDGEKGVQISVLRDADQLTVIYIRHFRINYKFTFSCDPTRAAEGKKKFDKLIAALKWDRPPAVPTTSPATSPSRLATTFPA
jgi:hypothetical protein